MNKYINLAHLKFFCDAVIYKNISEAAKMNFISQAAISQAITKLENIYGVPLFTHNKQILVLTKYGKIVFEAAAEIFKAIKVPFDQINEAKNEVSGVLEFVTTKSLGMSFLAPTYTKIKKNLPHIDLKIDMGGKSYIRQALMHGKVEFAIVVYDHNFSQFAKHSIKKGYFNLYQSINAETNPIDQKIFIDEEKGMYIENLKDFFSENNYSFKIEAISGWELVAHFTHLGIGAGFFPDYIASEIRFPNLKSHPIKLPLLEYEIAVIYNKSIPLSRLAQEFIEQFTLG